MMKWLNDYCEPQFHIATGQEFSEISVWAAQAEYHM